MSSTANASTARPMELTQAAQPCIALLGNPNVGKTSLFNRLTNLLAKTSNFPGTTVEVRRGTVTVDEQKLEVVDLPGLYSLEASAPDEQISRAFLLGERAEIGRPDALVVIVDATHLERTLFVAGQASKLGVPMVVAVNMIDLADKQRLEIDFLKLSQRLNCPVVPISARSGEGCDQLQAAMLAASSQRKSSELHVISDESCSACSGCAYTDGYRWAATVARECVRTGKHASLEFTERADHLLTHVWGGPLIFVLVMLVVFISIFWIAQYPMNFLDGAMGALAETVSAWLPASDLTRLLTQGVIGGVGAVLVFLPQICVLFFGLALLEDCGYLSRAVLVVDRWMRRVGLPGQAFVPLLAAHACAIPAIMSTRVIENRRDRLAAILVIPLMTCSARLPVYAMVATMLFPHQAWYAAMLFASAYALGMAAAFAMAFLFRLTILPGNPSPLILDLPPYRVPSLTNALRQAVDRGWTFIRDAGTIILLISVVIWALSSYPKPSEAEFQEQLKALPNTAIATDFDRSDDEQMEQMRMRIAQEYSILGRAGKLVQPVFAPLGFDWQTSVGVLSSFAAREVVVSTLAVLYGVGDDADSFIERISTAKRADGSRVFDVPTSVSLLVFFVLAMQCLPTQAVTRKETGSWKWAFFQFGYMTLLAYAAALLANQLIGAFV